MVKRMLAWGGLGCVLALVAGCGGSGGNNDQGIVFRAGGIFRTQTNVSSGTITCTEPTVGSATISDTAGTISLRNTLYYPNRTAADGDPCGGQLALENNLTSQSINVQFVTIDYDVPGAAVDVPTNPLNTGITIPPPTCEDCLFSSGQPGLVFLSLVQQLVSAETIAFLNQNVNRLPATPYTMNVYVTASGQSDQGTNYESNTIGYTISVTD